jgi:hypothetical protein
MDLTPRQHELIEAARTRRRMRELVTIEELSEFLAVSIRTIQRMHANDQGPSRIRYSHRLVYPVAGLLRWLPHLERNTVDKESRGEPTTDGAANRDTPRVVGRKDFG